MQKLTQEQKERLKKRRREVYLEMKHKRDNDPEFIALKEAQKMKRKEEYRKIKSRLKTDKESKKLEDRKKRENELMKRVTTANKIKSPENSKIKE